MAFVLITDIIIAVIAFATALLSGSPYLTMMLAGFVLIFTTARDMYSDGCSTSGRIILLILQLISATCFAVTSGGWWGFLIFACIAGISWPVALITGGLGYAGTTLIRDLLIGSGSADGRYIAMLIVETIILITVMSLMIVIRKIPERMSLRMAGMRETITNIGISELHEKKRSRDILSQNYYVEKNARLLERENISRNIHNSVGHSITAAIMTLDAADMLYEKDPQAARAKMNDAGARIRGSLESIRSAVRALDRDEQDVSLSDLRCYVDNIIDNFTMDTSIRVNKVYKFFADDIMIPGEHAEFLTGVLSEFLTNGVKHGGATEFTVLLEGDSGHIRLCVKDNGSSSFSEDTKDELIRNGFGLKKVISYVERYGGSAGFTSEDGNGFTAVVEIPWDAGASRGEG